MSDLHAAERERFEAWFRLKYLCAPDIESNLEALGRWQAWQARAALAPAVPPGWKMVPVEPTPEMAQALLDYSGEDELPWPTNVSPNYALAAYRILIAAAPSAKEPTCPKN